MTECEHIQKGWGICLRCKEWNSCLDAVLKLEDECYDDWNLFNMKLKFLRRGT